MSDQFRIVVNDRLVDIGDLKVAELKVELKKRGISVSGNKQELVDKLKNYLIKSQEHQQVPVPQFIPQAQVQYQSPQKLNQNIQFQPQQHHQSPEQFHHQFLQQQQQLQQSPQQIGFAANNFHIQQQQQQQQQLQHEAMLQQQLLQQQQLQQQQNFLNQQQLINNNLNNVTNPFPAVDSYNNPIITQAIEENHMNIEHNNTHINANNIQQVEMDNLMNHTVQESVNNHVLTGEVINEELQPVLEEQKQLVHEDAMQPVEVELQQIVEQEPNQPQQESQSVTEEQMDQQTNTTIEQEDNKENKKEEETHASSEEQTNKALDVSTSELNDSSKLNESVDGTQNGDLPKLQRKRKWLNNEAANILTNKKPLTISSDTLKTYLPTPPANQDEEHKLTASSTSNSEPDIKHSHTHVTDVQLEDQNELIYEDALTSTNNNNNSISQTESKQEEPIVAKANTVPTASPAKRPISNVLHVSNLTRPFTVPQLKELLSKYGRILSKDSHELFWINPVKSHCYVAFEKEEEARLAREALHNISWPQSNPKQLHIEYSKMDELVLHMNSDKPVSAPSKTSEKSSSAVNGSEKSHEPKESSDSKAKREQTATKTSSVREWDLPKLNRARSRSPVKERQHTTPSESKKEKTVSANNKPAVEQEKQQPKTLDDLFRKTKTAPFIYWLPLTEEQYSERQKEHEKRMADRLKRAEERKARETAMASQEVEKTEAAEVKAEENKPEDEKAETAANQRVRERETASEKEKLERERQREKDRERDRIRERERERERNRMRDTDRYRDREREREREMREREMRERQRERDRRRSPPTSYRRSSRDRQTSNRYESRPTRRRSPSTASSRSSSSRSSSSGSSSGSSRSSSRSSSNSSRSSSASSNGSKRENENKKNAQNVNLNNSSKHSRSSSESSSQRKKRRE